MIKSRIWQKEKKMNYIETNSLVSDEKIRYMPQKCKIPLFWHWVFGILFFWLLLIPLIKAIRYHIEFVTTEYAITDKKVIEKYGLLSVVCDEMKLEKIENVTISKTFWGNVFNYGDLHIQGANRNNVNFSGIKYPEEAKKMIHQML